MAATAKVTTQKLREIIGCSDQALVKSKGVYTYRRGFYFTNGKTVRDIQAFLESKLEAAGIGYLVVASGEQWKPFRGGDTLRQGSHWWVTFQIIEA